MAAAPAPTIAPGLLSCCPSPGVPEEAAAVVPTPPRPPPPLHPVSVCEGRGPSRGGEGALPPLLWGRLCGRSRRRRRCCCRCQIAREEKAVAAAANMFSVRIVTADYYMASPLQGLDICQSPLTQAPVKKVPVVRVFGATLAGKRALGAGGSRRGARAALPAAHTRALAGPRRGAAASSLPSALLAFPPVRDMRRKNVGPRERCAPSSPGGEAASAECLHCVRRPGAGSALWVSRRGSERPRPALWPRRMGQVAAPCPPVTGSRGGARRSVAHGPADSPLRLPSALSGGGFKRSEEVSALSSQPFLVASRLRPPLPLPEVPWALEWRLGPNNLSH